MLTGMTAGCTGKTGKGAHTDKLTVIEIETYYNGAAKIALDELVEEFNDTVGDEKGTFPTYSAAMVPTPWNLRKKGCWLIWMITLRKMSWTSISKKAG
ncbi:hypothetical protein N8H75_13000 [Extibacter muris]|nr:hypothetical protein [Extibacter muris]